MQRFDLWQRRAIACQLPLKFCTIHVVEASPKVALFNPLLNIEYRASMQISRLSSYFARWVIPTIRKWWAISATISRMRLWCPWLFLLFKTRTSFIAKRLHWIIWVGARWSRSLWKQTVRHGRSIASWFVQAAASEVDEWCLHQCEASHNAKRDQVLTRCSKN